MPDSELKVFAGSSNLALAQAICDRLDVSLGRSVVMPFSDGETSVEIHEHVRRRDVYVIQSTCSPANEHLMELLIMLDALRRASAATICAVIPYFGYARQDRKVASRSPITAKLVADLIGTAGATRVITMDLHAGQIQGFFNIPVDHLYALPVFLDDIGARYKPEETVIVSPDAGGVERARAYSKRHGSTLAIIDKRRPRANESQIMHIIGEVAGRHAVLIDDMTDTAGTLVQAAQALKDEGALTVVAYVTHAVLSGPAIERLAGSVLEELVVTDSIPLGDKVARCGRIRVLSVAPLFAKAIKRIHSGGSVSDLFI